MMNAFSLKGKTILVTGASSGIGRGIAVECSKMGAQIILNGRDENRLNETLGMMEGEGHQVLVADISKQEELDRIVAEVPVLDGCVLCAGIPQVCPVKHFKRNDIEEIFNVNTIAPMMITSGLLKKKKIRKGSSIVLIEAIAGVFVGSKGDVSYNASKAALNGFLKGSALELAGQGIRVNAINPGLVPTNILALNNEKMGDNHLEEMMMDRYPLKRFGKPEDIAYGAIYLLSDASSWVTGTNLVIDGGYILN